MKLSHFHAFNPLCPLCRASQNGDYPLNISFALQQTNDQIHQGVLVCSNPACQCEYPIIDGIPYLFPDIRKYLSDHHLEILLRDDLPIELLNILHEAAGGSSWLSSHRHQLSTYMHNHFGTNSSSPCTQGEDTGGGVVHLIQLALSLANNPTPQKALDIGCSVGRSTFQLAEQTHALTLGIDLSPLFLRKASQILKTHHATYDLRRSGLLYEQQNIPFNSPAAEKVDFWAADALCLPFPHQSLPLTVCLNVIDCVPSPVALLNEILRTTSSIAAIASPWDWTPTVTPEPNWIGGHSPRANFHGDSLSLLKSLLPQNIKILAEQKNIPWNVRLHDKHTAAYQTDLLILHCPA